MFGCFRKGEANDPEIYAAGIAKTLAQYPRECIDFVTDPVTGWPGKSDFFPSTKEIRQQCDAYMRPILTRERLAREAEVQLQSRKTFAITDGRPKPTYEELQRRCAEVGLAIGPKSSKIKTVAPEAFCEGYGISKEQFDAIPDAK